MDENLSRLALLVGEESLERIREKTVLLCGCGGVGSFVAEALARSGLGHIILVDDDFVEPSNLNRQLMTTKDNIGIKKVKALEKRLSQISDIEVKAWDLRIDENFKMPQVDYVIDCIDDLKAKFILAKKASFLKLPFIASMGSAKRLSVGDIKYTSLDKTRNDPLAKAYRQLVKKENYHRAIRVVYMDAPPLKQVDNSALGSAIFAVGACGLKIAAIVFAELIKGD